jgi:hypothetical protein|uniref:Uncharacterized protein n=1 Tax=viral metagenome TaxID=1070528 RepID=A0A6C0LUJ5_9ZZZZ|tara:strand:- start:5708 stop:6604 length:897 start_codon:yes stop_codon:yes gene_type:complete
MGSSGSAGLGLVLFAISTTFYFIFKMIFGKDTFAKDADGNIIKDENGNSRIISSAYDMKKRLFSMYFVVVIIGQLFVNLSMFKSMCNTSIASIAFPGIMYTIIPWVVIFGVIQVMFIMMPGWKAPFSNTIGYLVAKIAGLRTTIRHILKPLDLEDDTQLEGEQLKSFQTLREIYKDDSVLINEITPSNFDNFWKIMQKSQLIKTDQEMRDIPGTGGKLDTDVLRGKLQWFVGLKDDVSEFVWLMLTGSLVSSIVFNSMTKYKCTYSPEQIEAQDKKYKDSQEAKEPDPGDKQVYTSDE